MKTVIIDNYDSFTYNLSHLVKELGAEVCVVRNDRFNLDDIDAFDKIILSPGPGIPSEAGLLLDVIRRYAGVATPCHIIAEDPLFKGIAPDFEVGRYHSWVVSRENFPDCLEVTAVSDEGQVMALRHRTMEIHGIQFHPESVLTPEGRIIIQNFLAL